jgi:hypothetical protein
VRFLPPLTPDIVFSCSESASSHFRVCILYTISTRHELMPFPIEVFLAGICQWLTNLLKACPTRSGDSHGLQRCRLGRQHRIRVAPCSQPLVGVYGDTEPALSQMTSSDKNRLDSLILTRGAPGRGEEGGGSRGSFLMFHCQSGNLLIGKNRPASHTSGC